jgi:hypothetical protein
MKQFCWDMTMHQWIIGSGRFKAKYCPQSARVEILCWTFRSFKMETICVASKRWGPISHWWNISQKNEILSYALAENRRTWWYEIVVRHAAYKQRKCSFAGKWQCRVCSCWCGWCVITLRLSTVSFIQLLWQWQNKCAIFGHKSLALRARQVESCSCRRRRLQRR